MDMSLATVTLVVPDYDDAIEFYVSTLGFRLVEDTDLGDGKRWVMVTPDKSADNHGFGAQLLLAKADSEAQLAAIGNQTGGRVFLFLETSQFDLDYQRLISNGVAFLEQPREESYGKVAVFVDRYGNRWDLIQKKAAAAI